MKFSDQGIIIDLSNYGEGSVIAKLLTKNHGVCCGFVKYAKSKKVKAIYQIGNLISFEYRSRVDDNLGSFFTVDLARSYLANIIFDKAKLDCVRCLFFLISKAFLESEAQNSLFNQLEYFLNDANCEDANIYRIIANYVRLELSILNILGYGVDLSRCAATNSDINLTFVSPKSARAVSREAGLPYADKLLLLPDFLANNCNNLTREDLINGLKLSGYFLAKYIFEGNKKFTQIRSIFISNI